MRDCLIEDQIGVCEDVQEEEFEEEEPEVDDQDDFNEEMVDENQENDFKGDRKVYESIQKEGA